MDYLFKTSDMNIVETCQKTLRSVYQVIFTYGKRTKKFLDKIIIEN